jgi:hypothetical protein
MYIQQICGFEKGSAPAAGSEVVSPTQQDDAALGGRLPPIRRWSASGIAAQRSRLLGTIHHPNSFQCSDRIIRSNAEGGARQ